MGIEVEQAQGIDTVDPRARLVPVRPVFRELWVVAPGYEVVSVDYGVSRRRREALHAWASFDVGGDVDLVDAHVAALAMRGVRPRPEVIAKARAHLRRLLGKEGRR